MKRRQSRRTASADLLVCFHPGAHLTLMPKPICTQSPARHPDPSSIFRRRGSATLPPPSHLNRSHTRRARCGGGGGKGSHEFTWNQTKQMGVSVHGEELSEPCSPKVTCAGQIKARRRSSNWQSITDPLEKKKKKTNNKNKNPINWIESLGFKNEVMQFLTCLRSLHFGFRCSSQLRGAPTISSGGGEEEEEDANDLCMKGKDWRDDEMWRWHVVLNDNRIADEEGLDRRPGTMNVDDDGSDGANKESSCIVQPPPHALLLMRCRSAPAKNWAEERRREKEMVAEKKRETTLAILMGYEAYLDVGKGTSDPLSRSRSWTR